LQLHGLPQRVAVLSLRCVLGCFGRPKGQGTISPPPTSSGSYLASCRCLSSQGSYLISWGSSLTMKGSYLTLQGSYLTLSEFQSLGSLGNRFGRLKTRLQIPGLPERVVFFAFGTIFGESWVALGVPEDQGTISPSLTSWGSYLTSCGSYPTSQASNLTSWKSYFTSNGFYLSFWASYTTWGTVERKLYQIKEQDRCIGSKIAVSLCVLHLSWSVLGVLRIVLGYVKLSLALLGLSWASPLGCLGLCWGSLP
jgi:hypothetical protein